MGKGFFGGGGKSVVDIITDQDAAVSTPKMTSEQVVSSPKAKTATIAESELKNKSKFTTGLANKCMYVDGLAAHEIKWGTDISPIYDIKTYVPSKDSELKATGYRDIFRHMIGKSWLVYSNAVLIPQKYADFDFIPTSAMQVFKRYKTPVDNWHFLIEHQTSPGKLLEGNLIARSKEVRHVYSPQGTYTQHNFDSSVPGVNSLMYEGIWATESFKQKNPVFTNWTSFVNSNNKFSLVASGVDAYHYDHHFTMQKPYDHKSIEGAFINKPLYVKVVPHYNFTEPGYEGVISHQDVPTSILPNMYVFLSEMKLNYLDPNLEKGITPSQYLQIMTLDGALPNLFADVLLDEKCVDNCVKVGEKQSKPYYQLWTSKYDEISANTISAISAKLSNVGVCISDIDLIKDFNQKQNMFPMSMEIEFSTDQNTEFAEILSEKNLSRALMLEVMERTTVELEGGEDRFVAEPFVHISTTQPAMVDANGNFNTNWNKPSVSLNAHYNEVLDLDNWISDLSTVSYEKNVPNNAIFVGVDPADMSLGDMQTFEKWLKIVKFKKEYEEFVKDKFREDFAEMLNGNSECYSETLFYRVEKRVGNKIVQNFYLPNSSAIEILRFFDTQVKYGVYYTYSIYAYQLVVGTRYAYENFNISPPTQLTSDAIAEGGEPYDPWVATSRVNYEPCVKLIEVPWYEFTQAMIDHPPAPPNVDVVPYRGIRDEILFNMSPNNGEYLMDPVTIGDNDHKQHTLLRSAFQIPKGKPILYKGDDPVIAYEIYRTTKKPTNWKDFSQKLVRIVDTIEEGSSFRDKIKPNVKYYYAVRAIDRHYHFSNPSHIYEVELVSDEVPGNVGALSQISGLTAVKPRIRIVDFDAKIEKSLFKPMRRFLRIVPTMEQVELDMSVNPKSAYDKAAIKLGLTPVPLFGASKGRKFKVRLTSKKTGKKMDLNLNFKMNYVKFDKTDFETHTKSLFDVSYTQAEAALNELESDVQATLLGQSATITTDYQKKSTDVMQSMGNSIFSNVVTQHGLGGFTAFGKKAAELNKVITKQASQAVINKMVSGKNGGGGGTSSY